MKRMIALLAVLCLLLLPACGARPEPVEDFLAVLRNEAPFIDKDGQAVLLSEATVLDHSPSCFIPWEYALLDMDGDGEKEMLFADTSRTYYGMLHRQGTEIQGWFYSSYTLANPKTDGSFESLLANFSSTVLRVEQFTETEPEYTVLTEMVCRFDDEQGAFVYTVDGEPVTPETYERCVERQKAKKDVTWTRLPLEYTETVAEGVELTFAVDIGDSVSDQGEIKAIRIYREGALIQTMTPENCRWGLDRLFYLEDITFDGRKALLVALSVDGATEPSTYHFDAYLWQPETEQFVLCPSFRDIPNPVIDRANRQMISHGIRYDDNRLKTETYAEWQYVNGIFSQAATLSWSSYLGVPGEVHFTEWRDGELRADVEVPKAANGKVDFTHWLVEDYAEAGSYWDIYSDRWNATFYRAARGNPSTAIE